MIIRRCGYNAHFYYFNDISNGEFRIYAVKLALSQKSADTLKGKNI
jgi:hypothetical protein